ncbi:hypothetical protein FRC02_005429 [Tulasnella sp. 418]|nr:hypothetical protein FRC02_005429 [Tulasnella sp. 418]
MAKRKELAAEFEKGIGKIVQERLIDLDSCSPNNWLNDNFWIKKAYHEWRAPLPINSNWWLLFHDDTTIPQEIRDSIPQEGSFSDWQIRRAAWLVGRFTDFKDKLDRQEIHPDSSRTGPFCMHQYTRLFNICRVPIVGCDRVTEPVSPKSPAARSVLIIIKDWLYSLEVYEANGSFIGVKEVEHKLWDIVRDVESREQKGETPVPVNILTADERDTWARNREYLMALSPENRSVMKMIEGSLFALCLDAHTLAPRPSSQSPHLTKPNIDAQVLNCAAGGPTGANRWFDKALTVCVENNGRAGMMGEHSPCDALIPSIIVDYAIAEHIKPEAFDSAAGKWSLDTEDSVNKKQWQRLDWVLDDTVRKECESASQRAKALIADSDPSQLWFAEYGADWIKTYAKLSPDAYIQMALQLAWYKDQGSMTATYETASTRLFAHGRTDVIRTLSTDSRSFVKSMADPSSSRSVRLGLLQKAVASHNLYTRDASTGKGADRHLMGLKWLLRDGETSPFFEDPLYSKSAEWKLSTSGLSAGTRFFGTGFGTVWPDGYGINYLAGPKLIKFGIESKVSCEKTSTHAFKTRVVESLQEMGALFDAEGATKAKL